MSESLTVRWILKHWLDVARTYGANIHDAPVVAQKRKVQITQFITFPRNDHPDDAIWVRVSDKQHEVIIKLTQAAMAQYNTKNNVLGPTGTRRLTARRYALAVISGYKPFFSRVPLANGKGMDLKERLALEVNAIDVIGASNEVMFGNPIDVECDEDMKEWVEGLREGGGGGNVLKFPKEQLALKKPTALKQQPIESPFPVVAPSDTNNGAYDARESPRKSATKSEVNRKPEKKETKMPSKAETTEGQDVAPIDLLKEWNKRWRAAARIWPFLVDVPYEIQVQHDQILKFGQDAKGAKRDDVCQVVAATESASSENKGDQQEDRPDCRGPIVVRKNSDASRSVDRDLASSLPPSEGGEAVHKEDIVVKEEKNDDDRTDGSANVPRQSTPSEWADSDEERNHDSDQEDVVEQAEATASSLARSARKEDGSDAEENADDEDVENEDVEVFELKDEDESEYQNEEDDGESDDDGDEGEEESELEVREPTPAQRRKPRTQSQSESQSQRPTSSSKPSSALGVRMGITTYQMASDISMTLDTSQSQEAKQAPAFQHLVWKVDRYGERPPRILVPDSDTSGNVLSQSQSQSQSQPHSQPQPQLQSQPQSQPQAQSQSQAQILSSQGQGQNQIQGQSRSHSPLAIPIPSNSLQESDSVQKVSSSMAEVFGDRKGKGLSQSQSESSVQQKSRSRKKNNENVKRTKSLPALSQVQLQSQTQPESQESGADPFVVPPHSAKYTTLMAQLKEEIEKEIEDGKRLRGENLAKEENVRRQKDGQTRTSATQENSQESRTQKSTLDESGDGKSAPGPGNTPAEPELEPETLASMDADDAQTHALLHGHEASADFFSDTSRRPEPGPSRHTVRDAAKEQERLAITSLQQASPSAHLGKRARTASTSLHSGSSVPRPAVRQQDKRDSQSPMRKKARISSSSTASVKDEYIKQSVEHNQKAWKRPSFLQRQEAGLESRLVQKNDKEALGIDNGDEASAGRKRKAERVKNEIPLIDLTSEEASISTSVLTSPRKSEGTVHRSQMHSNSKSSSQSMSVSTLSIANSSKVKFENAEGRSATAALLATSTQRLKGYTVNLDLVKEPEGPQWLTWEDTARILLNMGRKRYEARVRTEGNPDD